jgi:hypothetical protein
MVLAAQQKTEFDDHLQEDGELTYRVASRNGYRGAALELAVFAGIILPHVSSLNKVLPFIAKDENGKSVPELQVALIREAHTAAKGADNLITVIVMKGVARRVLAGKTDSNGAKLPKDLTAAAKGLDESMKTGDVEDAMADFDNVRSDLLEAAYPDLLYEEGIAQSMLVAVVIVGLLLAVPLLFAAKGVSDLKLKLTRGPEGLKENPVLWCLWALVLILSASAVLVGLLKAGPAQSLLTMFGIIGREHYVIVGRDMAGPAAVLLGLAVLLIPRRPAKVGTTIAVVYTVLPLLYLATVVKTLQVDQTIKGVVKSFRTEVDTYRGNW